MGPVSRITTGVSFLLACSSCFSPERAGSLSCSAEGLCPGAQVCDYDNVCRSSYTNDGGASQADSGSSSDAGNSLNDASGANGSIVPTGPTLVTSSIGLPGIGMAFGSIGCNAGEVMYGIEGRMEEMELPNGFCEFKVRCGHLTLVAGNVVLLKDGEAVPAGLGVPECETGNTAVELECPDNTVITGWTGIRTIPAPLPRVTSLSLQCTEISPQATLLGSQEVGPIGLTSSGKGEQFPPQSVTCRSGSVGFGFRGRALSVVDSFELRCRALMVEK